MSDRGWVCGLVACLLFAGMLPVRGEKPAAAVGRPPPGAGPRWGAGAGAFYRTSPYEGVDHRFIPLPVVTYRGPRLEVFGPRARYLLGRWGGLAARLVGGVSFDGYEAGDSTALRGMSDRRWTARAGVGAEYDLPWRLGLALEAATDVLGRHDGQDAVLTLSRDFGPGGPWAVTPEISLVGYSAAYADYYYGVRAAEATDARPAYAPGAEWTVQAGVRVRRRLGGAWMAGLGVSAERLSEGLTDSPIVDGDLVWRSFVSVTRAF